MSKIERALAFAVEAHACQVDKQGEPYILHALRVMQGLGPHADEDLRCAALLHDVIEDTDTGADEIRALFGDSVADIVKTLTRDDPSETYRDYIARVALSERASIVKRADLRDNISRLNDLAKINPDKARSLRERYAQAVIDLGDSADRHTEHGTVDRDVMLMSTEQLRSLVAELVGELASVSADEALIRPVLTAAREAATLLTLHGPDGGPCRAWVLPAATKLIDALVEYDSGVRGYAN